MTTKSGSLPRRRTSTHPGASSLVISSAAAESASSRTMRVAASSPGASRSMAARSRARPNQQRRPTVRARSPRTSQGSREPVWCQTGTNATCHVAPRRPAGISPDLHGCVHTGRVLPADTPGMTAEIKRVSRGAWAVSASEEPTPPPTCGGRPVDRRRCIDRRPRPVLRRSARGMDLHRFRSRRIGRRVGRRTLERIPGLDDADRGRGHIVDARRRHLGVHRDRRRWACHVTRRRRMADRASSRSERRSWAPPAPDAACVSNVTASSTWSSCSWWRWSSSGSSRCRRS